MLRVGPGQAAAGQQGEGVGPVLEVDGQVSRQDGLLDQQYHRFKLILQKEV